FADFFVYHDDSIVQVATFYEVVLKQHFQFMEEAEGPGRCNGRRKLIDVADGSMLATEHRRIKVDHTGKTIAVQWHGHHFHFPVSFCMMDIMRNFVIIAIRILIGVSSFFEDFHKRSGTAVHDRYFGPVDVDEHVVYLQSYKGCHQVFDRAYAGSVLGDCSTPGRIRYVVRID